MRHKPEVRAEGRIEALARCVATRLKNETGPNQDLLSDLCDGGSFESLARSHTSGNISMLRTRLATLFDADHLNIPFPPESHDARDLIDRAFDLMEEMG